MIPEVLTQSTYPNKTARILHQLRVQIRTVSLSASSTTGADRRFGDAVADPVPENIFGNGHTQWNTSNALGRVVAENRRGRVAVVDIKSVEYPVHTQENPAQTVLQDHVPKPVEASPVQGAHLSFVVLSDVVHLL